MALLTDQILSTGLTVNDLIHVVNTDDTSQNPAGSSYKATISQVIDLFTGTTGTSGSSGTSGTSGIDGTSGVNVISSNGLFSQTGDSVNIINTTTETSIIGGGVGTLSVPENGFNVGDSFRLVIGGIINNQNNDRIQIRIKSDSVILSDSGLQTLSSNTNEVFKIVVDFTIRNVGVAGNASILTLGDFKTVKKNGGSVSGFSYETINNTDFDTTVSNTLEITVKWEVAGINRSIYSQLLTLTKVY